MAKGLVRVLLLVLLVQVMLLRVQFTHSEESNRTRRTKSSFHRMKRRDENAWCITGTIRLVTV